VPSLSPSVTCLAAWRCSWFISLDEEEDIEILRIEVPSLLRELDALAGENYRIFDGVYLFAYGLVFSGLADALHSEHTEAKGG